MNHTVTVRLVEATIRHRPAWWAACPCGWDNEGAATFSDAVAEGQQHLDEKRRRMVNVSPNDERE